MKPLPKKKNEGYKAGCNKNDQMAIVRLAAEGKTSTQISNLIKVNEASVKSFMPKKKRVKKED